MGVGVVDVAGVADVDGGSWAGCVAGGGAGAVYCRLPEQVGAGALLALFLPAEEEADIGATLVVGSGVYERDRALQIDVGGREIGVRAGRLVSNSPVFDRFEFAAE